MVFDKNNPEHYEIFGLFEKINSQLEYKKSINDFCSFATLDILVKRAKLKKCMTDDLLEDLKKIIELRDQFYNEEKERIKKENEKALTVISVDPWVVYYDSRDFFWRMECYEKKEQLGKWICFYKDVGIDSDKASDICKKAILEHIVSECKHSNNDDKTDGVICFYTFGDSEYDHYRIIRFMLENNLIPKTKTGRLYNISFKYDYQTRSGQYGKSFVPKLTLDKFVDLNTGEFIYTD